MSGLSTFAENGGDASVGATVVCNEDGNVFQILVKNTPGVRNKRNILIDRLFYLVLHGRQS